MQLYEYTVNSTNGTKTNVYVIAYANNLNLGANGTVSWDIELGSKGYKDYDNLVTNYVTKNKEYYNVTQIK